MKRLIFYLCLIFSIVIVFVIPIIASEIPFKGIFTGYYIAISISWLYIILLVASIYFPIKFKLPRILIFMHIFIVTLYVMFSLFIMNAMTP